IAVGAATVSRLAFVTQPGNATAGSAFGTQPVVNSQDQFGNKSTLGLPSTLNVNLTLTSGSGPLQGMTVMDIGAAGANGVAVFTDLEIDAAGAGKQLTASASGLTSDVSSAFTV